MEHETFRSKTDLTIAQLRDMFDNFVTLMELKADSLVMEAGIKELKAKYDTSLRNSIAGYIRTSSDDSAQVLSQVGLIVQSLLAGENPKSCSFQLYIDNGFSGLDTSRPAYQALLQDMNDGKVLQLILVDMDRLSRGGEAYEEIIHIARECNVEIVTIR